MSREVDYGPIAKSYDERYVHHDYAGIEATLRELAADGAEVLEVGCGTGHWVEWLDGQGGHVVGVDPSADMLRNAGSRGRRLRLARGCAEALPFRTGSFDLLLVINALHHFTDPDLFFREAKRVVRGSGRVVTIGLDPSREEDDWYVYDYFDSTLGADRIRYPSSSSIQASMLRAGFRSPRSSVAQRIMETRDARECLERGTIAKRATSQLALLTDAEYRDGIALIRADIAGAESRKQRHELRADLRLYATIGHAGNA